jgi:hypothetical protein
LTVGSSIPVRWLCAGSTLFLVCGLASAQTAPISASAKRARPSIQLRYVSTATSQTGVHKGKKTRKSATNSRKRGQQKIDPARSQEIQEALIREHYLDGPASGVWDAKCQSAMVRFQSDNGWQSKVVPDSRALIKLGLGPDHEHLLNPGSAMTSQPATPHASSMMNQRPTVVVPPQK